MSNWRFPVWPEDSGRPAVFWDDAPDDQAESENTGILWARVECSDGSYKWMSDVEMLYDHCVVNAKSDELRPMTESKRDE